MQKECKNNEEQEKENKKGRKQKKENMLLWKAGAPGVYLLRPDGLETHTLCATSVSLCPNKPPVPTKEYDIEKNSDTIGITTSSIFPFQ